MKLWLSAILLICWSIHAEDFRIDGIRFFCRVPAKYNGHSRILVLFGGRNWPGNKTLQSYRFDSPADQHQVFLLPRLSANETCFSQIHGVNLKNGLVKHSNVWYIKDIWRRLSFVSLHHK